MVAVPITEREQEVLRVLMQGVTLEEAAETLSISRRTLEKHRDNVLRKYGVKRLIQLAAVLPAEMKPAPPASTKDLAATVVEMQRQIATLQAQVQELLAARSKPTEPTSEPTHTSRTPARAKWRARAGLKPSNRT